MNTRWFLSWLVISAILMYAGGPNELMQVVVWIGVAFAVLAGLVAPFAVAAAFKGESAAKDHARSEAAQLFSLGLGSLVGAMIAYWWLIPAVPYWK